MTWRSRAVALFGWLLTLALVGGWIAFLRPPALGGSTGYVFIRGDSMEPTYEPGDLVLVREAPRYAEGDVVAFHPPDSKATVIHRIIGFEGGAFQMRGDNRDVKDPWEPPPRDVVGAAVVRIPRAGVLLSRLQQPLLLGALCALITFLTAMSPTIRLRRRVPQHRDDIVPCRA